MAETLASTINQPLDPFSIVGQVSKRPGLIERGTAARQALEPTMRAGEATRSEARRLEKEGKQQMLAQEEKQTQASLKRTEQAVADYETVLGSAPKRDVRRFNPDAAMELAAMTAILGAFAGAGSGRGALAAMEGITEGYRLGEQDRYEDEVKRYESELQAYKDRIGSAKTTLDNVLKLEAARKGAGAIELKKLETQIAGTVGEAQARAGNYQEVSKFLQDAMTAADKAQQKLLESTGSSGAGGGGIQVPAGVDVEGVQVVPGAGVPRVTTSVYEGLPTKLQESFARTEQQNYAKEAH